MKTTLNHDSILDRIAYYQERSDSLLPYDKASAIEDILSSAAADSTETLTTAYDALSKA